LTSCHLYVTVLVTEEIKIMKRTITKSGFRDAFHNMDREDQFSYDGLGALFDWLEEMEQGTDTEMKLDVIALCCEFTEWGNVGEYNAYAGTDFESIDELMCDMDAIPLPDGEGFITCN
jgi:secreted PhoX family phosphatase